MAEISYFASTLREGAMLWFNSLTISNEAPVVVGAIGTLAELCEAFEAHYLFDPAQKRRYLSDFFKTRQTHKKKSEDFIRRVQEEGLKARANAEHIRSSWPNHSNRWRRSVWTRRDFKDRLKNYRRYSRALR